MSDELPKKPQQITADIPPRPSQPSALLMAMARVNLEKQEGHSAKQQARKPSESNDINR